MLLQVNGLKSILIIFLRPLRLVVTEKGPLSVILFFLPDVVTINRT